MATDANGHSGARGIMFPNREGWVMQRYLGMRRTSDSTGRFYPMAISRQINFDKQQTPSCSHTDWRGCSSVPSVR